MATHQFMEKSHFLLSYSTFSRSLKLVLQKNGTVVAFVSLNDECGHAVNITNITEIPFLYAESNEDEKRYRKENILPY